MYSFYATQEFRSENWRSACPGKNMSRVHDAEEEPFRQQLSEWFNYELQELKINFLILLDIHYQRVLYSYEIASKLLF